MAVMALSAQTGLMPVLIAVICFACVLRLATHMFYNVYKHPLTRVPGPFLAKLTGQYLTPASMSGRRAHVLFELHQKYGSAVRVGPNEVSISDAAMYREIYNQTASRKEESFYRAGSFLGHENIFSLRNKPQHAARRKLQRQPYSQQAVLENEQLIALSADRLVQRMMLGGKKAGSHCCVDVFPFCGLFSIEIICKAAFNKSWDNSSETGVLKLLEEMDGSAMLLPIDAVMPFLKTYGIGQYVPGPIGDAFKHFHTWTEMTRTLLREFGEDNVSKDPSQRFMATPLLMTEDAFLGRRLTEDEAVEESMGIAFAGSGTTSTTLTYLLYNLSLPENSHHQLRLREELLNAGETLNELQHLPFLNAVIKETMRLNPTIISTLPRTLDAEITIHKLAVTLPVGTIVGMQNYVHHRDPLVFPDAESFRPERWLGNCEVAEKTITPFSLGPRNCIGQNLARAELYLAVSKIFRRLFLMFSSHMTKKDMEMEDRFNIAPKGRKLWLDVEVLE